MAEIIRYFRKDSTLGGDGTQDTATGANRAYVSMNDLDAGEVANHDLVAGGNTFRAIRGSDDGSAIDEFWSSSNWTTGPSNWLSIESVDGSRKVWENTTTNVAVVSINRPYVRISGFEIHQNQPGSFWRGLEVVVSEDTSSSEIIADNLKIHGTGHPRTGFYVGGGLVKISNCESINNAGEGFASIVAAATPAMHLRYCVAYGNNQEGIRHYSGLTDTVINCYFGGNGANDYHGAAASRAKCYTSDTTGTAGHQNVAASTTSGAYFLDLTPGAENFLFDHSQSALADAGDDVSSDPDYAVSTDARGFSRHPTTPDVGEYEIQTAGGPVTGTFAAQAQAATTAFTGVRASVGSFTADVQPATTTFLGVRSSTGSLTAPAQAAAAAFAGVKFTGSIGDFSAQAQNASAAFSGARVGAGSFAANASPAQATFSGTRIAAGSFSASAGAAGASFAGARIATGSFAVGAQPATGAFSGSRVQMVTGSFAAVARPARAYFTDTVRERRNYSASGSAHDPVSSDAKFTKQEAGNGTG